MSEICDYIQEHHNAREVRRVFGKLDSTFTNADFILAKAGSRITIVSICGLSTVAGSLTIQGLQSNGTGNSKCNSNDFLGSGSDTTVVVNFPANVAVNICPPEGLGLFSLPDGNGMRISVTAGASASGFFSISYIVSKIQSTLNNV